MSEIRDDVTPELIAGNASKYVGTYVLIQCQIHNVVTSGDHKVANAACTGASGQGDDSALVITGDVGNFDAGQSVTILGKVADPSEGTNGFGSSTAFPTVQMMFLNPSQQAQPPANSGNAESNNASGSTSNADSAAVAVVERYYSLWNQRRYDEMYAMLGPEMKSKLPYPDYVKYHDFVQSISVEATQDSDPNIVDVRISSTDHDVNGNSSSNVNVGTWTLETEGGQLLLATEQVHAISP